MTKPQVQESDCAVCEGRDLGTTDGPDGREMPVVCGACTEPPGTVWATAAWCWSCDIWISPPQTECPGCGRAS